MPIASAAASAVRLPVAVPGDGRPFAHVPRRDPAPAAVPTPPVPTLMSSSSGLTQTELAREHFTPRSAQLLPDALLDARIGRSTFAGALNDQIRFRVSRTGADPAAWPIVPDSPVAAALVQTAAGPALLRQLSTAVKSTGSLGKVSNLNGFILAKDTEAVVAATALAAVDNRADPGKLRGHRSNDTKESGRLLRSAGHRFDRTIPGVAAWNDDGWITFMPHASRQMLSASGAYMPDARKEPDVRYVEPEFLASMPSHEVQHSVSGPSPAAYTGAAKWIEEGAAEVFSTTPVFRSKLAAGSGVTAKSWWAALSRQPVVDLGWGTWTPPRMPPAKQQVHATTVARNYEAAPDVLRDLVRLAGADFRSTAGQEKAFQLLQAKSMRYTPGVLADAIIEQHGLDPKVRERLRERIRHAVDIEGGARTIAEEFGIS